MDRPFKAGKGQAVGWIALVLSFGFILLYMPGMPAALIWPYEWIMVAGWTAIGAYFYWQMNKGKYNRHIEESEGSKLHKAKGSA